jgi:NDP-sugar pyrophosphorylase family protein
MPVQAAILAGGEGTRMSSFSDTPKVLLPLGGKPILVHQLEWLKQSGFSEVFLCLGHRADEIMEALGDGSRYGLRIDYRVENVARGTAGAVKDIEESLSGDLLVVYGDLFINIDFGKLLEFHASHDGVATLMVRHTDHPEDSDIAEVDKHARILAIGRLSAGEVTGDLGCAAVWVIRRPLLDKVPLDKPSDFARDIFPEAARSGDKLMAYVTSESVLDVGTPKRYEKFLQSCQKM